MCYGKRGISADDDFLQYLHPTINIMFRFPFSCPFGRLIMQWSYQLFIESHSKFLYTEGKSFDFFSAYLIEIDQVQLKNSNCRVMLSAWLVSMENLFDGSLSQRSFYFCLTFTRSNQSIQRKHKNRAWDLRVVFRTLSNI